MPQDPRDRAAYSWAAQPQARRASGSQHRPGLRIRPTSPSVSEASRLGDALVPPGRSWEFNQSMFDLGATVCTAEPRCDECPLRRHCAWRRQGSGAPDPWRASPLARPQSTFAGSDRQGRGRLLDALRRGPVSRGELAAACGWPDDGARAERVAGDLVTEGFACWSRGRTPVLSLVEAAPRSPAVRR